MDPHTQNPLLNKLAAIAITNSDRLRAHKHNKQRAGIALGVILAFATIFVALFFTVAHGSLAPIYAANLPLRADNSEAKIEQQLVSAAQAYKITLRYPDKSVKTFPLTASGVSVDAKHSAKNAKQVINNSLGRRLQWWRPIKLPLYTKTNNAKLEDFIAHQATVVKTAPKDASLSFAGGSVVLNPEVIGEGNGLKNAQTLIPKSVARLDSASLNLVPIKLPAAITTQDLKASQSKAQSILSQPVSFGIAGRTVVPTPSDIAGWVDLTPVPKAKTVDVTVDSGRVLKYINTVSKRYITPPRSRLIVNTDHGQVVLDPGSNGVDVVNKDQTAATVAKQLLESKGVQTNLPVQYAAAKTVEAQPYSKWIVVDITTKRMYAYQGTGLVRTFLVSAGAPATPTVTGRYAIYAKYGSQDMHGLNADGSRYFQPKVPYVSYFYGGYAIHGNYWRPASWFGNINSSHGCVGITTDDGAWMYDWAPIGTPVLVHK